MLQMQFLASIPAPFTGHVKSDSVDNRAYGDSNALYPTTLKHSKIWVRLNHNFSR